MDKAQQKLQQFRNQYKTAQQDLNKTNSKDIKEANSNISSADVLAKLSSLEDKLNKVSNENNTLKTKNKQLVKQQEQKAKLTVDQNNEKAMGDVLSGFSQKFSKDYSFPVVDGDPIEFKIVMKPMAAFDIAKIRNDTVDLTNARYRYYDADTAYIMESISAIKELGEEYPDWLVDIEHLHRTDIPVVVYQDYNEWLATFRQSSKR